MKILVCRDCISLVKLRSLRVSCLCGRSGGMYFPDDVRAAVWGPCEVLGINNDEFRSAIMFPGRSGTWTILPRDHKRVVRFDNYTSARAALRAEEAAR